MELITVTRAAAMKGVTVHAVRYWLRRGLLRGRKFGRDWSISRDDLDEFELPTTGRPRHRREPVQVAT